jgi:hypothetical protein
LVTVIVAAAPRVVKQLSHATTQAAAIAAFIIVVMLDRILSILVSSFIAIAPLQLFVISMVIGRDAGGFVPAALFAGHRLLLFI